jgi:hypothetical protein
MKLSNKLAHYGDLLAIPLFTIVFFYFYSIPDKTLFEYFLMLVMLGAVIVDIIFSLIYLFT